MRVCEILIEILEQYPQEYEKDNKISSPYYRDLKQRIEKTFAPLLDEYGLEINALGGLGVMRKTPYITFLAEGHRTNKGIYPIYHFDLEQHLVYLDIGDADDHEPPQALVNKFVALSAELLSQFQAREEDGYPQKIYAKDELQEDTLIEDLKTVFEVYQLCLEEFDDEVRKYLTNSDQKKIENIPEDSVSMTSDQIHFLIDKFLEWYGPNEQRWREESIDEYQQFSRAYFSSLSDEEFVEAMFRFAYEGGKIQSGGHRTANMFRKSIQARPDEFRQRILEIFNENFDIEQWWSHMDSFKGFGKGIRSIFLHRVFPDHFTIFNNKSRDAYQLVGLLDKKKPYGAFEYGSINDAAKKLIAYRPDVLNLNRADAMTHFLIGTKEGQQALREIPSKTILPEAQITDTKPRYWAISPGENARLWEDFKHNSIIAIGWDQLGDLMRYDNKEAIRKELQRIESTESSKVNDTLACYEFSRVMQIGDYVFVKKGLRTIIGFGQVTSDYFYDNSRPEYHHVRSVRWLSEGAWEIPEEMTHIAVKTLTDLTPYQSWLEAILDLIGYQSSLDNEKPSLTLDIPQPRPFSKEDALAGLFLDEDTFDEILARLKYKKNIILQGPPGVGKSFIAKRLAYTLIGFKDDEKVEMIQFHQAYSYEDFIQGFRPNEDGKFFLKNGVFYNFCKKAQRDVEHPYVFIIDEINRGNLSKIFGELMLLVEPDKRGKEFAMPLTYSESSDEKLYIPDNVHFIGMMNTADRSLAMVDYALRRRFSFVNLEPQFSSPKFTQFLLEKGVEEVLIEKIITRITKVNEQITQDHNLGWGYCIGHSFFCPNETIDQHGNAWYQQVITYEIAPLIREYWFDDSDKADAIIKSLRAL